MEYKDNKEKQGKPMLGLIPPLSQLVLAEAMGFGTNKYAPWDWTKGTKTMDYVDAALRHINVFVRGENCAPDSGVHHIGHALACLSILYDNLVLYPELDNRPKVYREFKEALYGV